MQAIKIIGIIAFAIAIAAFIARCAIKWFAPKWEYRDKAMNILKHVATASLVVTAACGIVYLFV